MPTRVQQDLDPILLVASYDDLLLAHRPWLDVERRHPDRGDGLEVHCVPPLGRDPDRPGYEGQAGAPVGADMEPEQIVAWATVALAVAAVTLALITYLMANESQTA